MSFRVVKSLANNITISSILPSSSSVSLGSSGARFKEINADLIRAHAEEITVESKLIVTDPVITLGDDSVDMSTKYGGLCIHPTTGPTGTHSAILRDPANDTWSVFSGPSYTGFSPSSLGKFAASSGTFGTLYAANGIFLPSVGSDTFPIINKNFKTVGAFPFTQPLPRSGGTLKQIMVNTTTATQQAVFTVPAGKYVSLQTAIVSSTVGSVWRYLSVFRGGTEYHLFGATVAANTTSVLTSTGTVSIGGDVIYINPSAISDMTWILNFWVWDAAEMPSVVPLIYNGILNGTQTIYTCPTGYVATFLSAGWGIGAGPVKNTLPPSAATITAVSTSLVRGGQSYMVNRTINLIGPGNNVLFNGLSYLLGGDEIRVTSTAGNTQAQFTCWLRMYSPTDFPVDTAIG